jgi:hypothetical protein
MSIPPFDPEVAAEHSMSELMVKGLLDRVEGREITSHGNTMLALQGRGLVVIDGAWNISVTTAGHQVAARLKGQPEPRKAPTFDVDAVERAVHGEPTPAEALAEQTELDVPVGPLSPERLAELQEDVRRHTRLTPDQQDREAARELPPPAGPFLSQRASWAVVLTELTESDPDPTLVAVVVGDHEDAQAIADLWNLDHLADIAATPDARYAVSVQTDVDVHVFDRPAA